MKYLWSALWRSRSLRGPDFPYPLEPGLGPALSQLHVLCVAQLLLAPRIIFLRCATINLQNFACFVPSNIHNLTRAVYSSNGFHKLSWPGLEPATPRWESRHSDHGANPTCLKSWLDRISWSDPMISDELTSPHKGTPQMTIPIWYSSYWSHTVSN